MEFEKWERGRIGENKIHFFNIIYFHVENNLKKIGDHII